MGDENYKRGDMVRVVSNDYKNGEPFHYFTVGDAVAVKRVLPTGVCFCTDKKGLEQYLNPEHIEPLNH